MIERDELILESTERRDGRSLLSPLRTDWAPSSDSSDQDGLGVEVPTERVRREPPRAIDRVAGIVEERGNKYGPPEENHSITAAMVTAYLSRKLLPGAVIDKRDVCWINILQKASRDTYVRDQDNIDDSIGYLDNADSL